MGIKLEYIVVVIIVVLIAVTTTRNLASVSQKSLQDHKEFEFMDTTFIEVDTERLQGKLYTPYGVRSDGILTLDKINYYTDNIQSLLADKGIYKETILYLNGHVSLKESNGNLYKSEHAIYDQKKEILTIPSPFVAYMDRNIFHGETLVYSAITKEANATKVDAVVFPKEE